MKTLNHVSKALSLTLLISMASAPAMDYVRTAGKSVTTGLNATTTAVGKAGSWVANKAFDTKDTVLKSYNGAKLAYINRVAQPAVEYAESKSEILGNRAEDVFLFPIEHPTATKAGIAAVAGLAVAGYGAYKYLNQEAAVVEENKENNDQLVTLAAQAKNAADAVAQGQKATFVAQSVENVDAAVNTLAQSLEQAVNSFNATENGKARKTRRTIQRQQAAQQHVAAAHAQFQKAVEVAISEQAQEVTGISFTAKAIAAKNTAVEYTQLAWELAKENAKEAAAVAAVLALASWETYNACYNKTDKWAITPWAKAGAVKAKDGIVSGAGIAKDATVSGLNKTAEVAKKTGTWTKDTAKKGLKRVTKTVKDTKYLPVRVKSTANSFKNRFAKNTEVEDETNSIGLSSMQLPIFGESDILGVDTLFEVEQSSVDEESASQSAPVVAKTKGKGRQKRVLLEFGMMPFAPKQ